MSWFNRNNDNKNLHSEEYEAILTKIVKLSGDVGELNNQFKILETNYNNLRGNFNRKLSGIKKGENLETEEETQSLNPQVILPE